jgi:hypothetical protein
LNLICPAITLLHVKALKVVRQMIRSPGIHDPRRKNRGTRRGRVPGALLVVVGVVGADELGVEAVPTLGCGMPPVATNLALRTLTTTAIASVLAVPTAVAAVVRAAVATTGGLAIGLTVSAPANAVCASASAVLATSVASSGAASIAPTISSQLAISRVSSSE